MPNKKYKIAVIQLNLNDVAENNLKKCLSWVRDAANQGAEVITLPELYSSHYFCQSEDVDNFALAEPLYSTSFIAFSALAKELGVVIIVPFSKKNGWCLSQ
jgi:N-carbamoylputrescine amidase